MPENGTLQLIDVQSIASMLNCSPRHVLRLADRGAMPWGTKIGSLRRWNAGEIEEWIRQGCKPVRKGANR